MFVLHVTSWFYVQTCVFVLELFVMACFLILKRVLGENALAKPPLPPRSCLLLHLYEEVSKTVMVDFCTPS